uniref:Uncharacterized protein n=1 Tax=Neobodo designis TaxID=312471 RepID=A0A7S1M057_NEODS|mmetsp:Transcript_31622/g.97726  ORF Transcript_31622/g.97726 Transcript_31622/m.97726 type:complete len:193 (+) Transcript_31622:59-637(+)
MHCVPAPSAGRGGGSWEQRHVLAGRMEAHMQRVRRARCRVDTDSPAGWHPSSGEPYESKSEQRRRRQRRFEAMRQTAAADASAVHYEIDDRPRSPPRPVSAGATRHQVTVHAPHLSRRPASAMAKKPVPRLGRADRSEVAAGGPEEVINSPAFAAFVSALAGLNEADRAEVMDAAGAAAYDERLMRQFREAM